MEQFILDESNSFIIFNSPVVHLGVQGAPGAKFRINYQSDIVLGPAGIYELDLKGKSSYITSVELLNGLNHVAIIDAEYLRGGI